MSDDQLDLIVLGAGLRGLRAALEAQRDKPGLRLAVVDGLPQPGASVRTQRSNGFVCELGPFAFARDEVAPLLALLPQAPRLLECLPQALQGQLLTPAGTQLVGVDPVPVSFASGTEELPQACRRALGAALRLGREAVRIDHDGDHFSVELGGEVAHRLEARSLVSALPPASAGRLLGRFDPALAQVAARCTTEPAAFAFFGGEAAAAPEVRGYGVLPRSDVETTMLEAIFCSQVFPGRALAGRFLVRCELLSRSPQDHEALAMAEAELRRWTGLRAQVPFTKLHRFEQPVADGALAECNARLRCLPQRVPNLRVV